MVMSGGRRRGVSAGNSGVEHWMAEKRKRLIGLHTESKMKHRLVGVTGKVGRTVEALCHRHGKNRLPQS